ncbi:MAG: holo-ACP synthase [Gammaproteobacteria bacterium]|nr:holo-ACP synthase [Gammaproteobacteria bacterium]
MPKIYGVGTDICEIYRIETAWHRFGHRLSQRILTPAEIHIFMAMSYKRKITYLASRFSAKESLSKALGLGIRHPFTWQNCAILTTEFGKPEVCIYRELHHWCAQKNLMLHISLSDEKNYVLSYALAEWD